MFVELRYKNIAAGRKNIDKLSVGLFLSITGIWKRYKRD